MDNSNMPPYHMYMYILVSTRSLCSLPVNLLWLVVCGVFQAANICTEVNVNKVLMWFGGIWKTPFLPVSLHVVACHLRCATPASTWGGLKPRIQPWNVRTMTHTPFSWKLTSVELNCYHSLSVFFFLKMISSRLYVVVDGFSCCFVWVLWVGICSKTWISAPLHWNRGEALN